MSIPPGDRGGFQVALFCALAIEAEHVRSMFDDCWEDQNIRYGKAIGDQNAYTTGTIGKCNVVLVHMPSMGANSAALAAAGLRSSFPRIQLALVVGICGVVPVHPETKEEIVLGDVVISTAVIQYDFGRQYPGGFQRKNTIEDSLGRANPEIRSFLNMLTVSHNRKRFNKSLEGLVKSKEFQDKDPAAVHPGVSLDRLYKPSYAHQHRPAMTCDKCLTGLETCSKPCDELGCDKKELITRNQYIQESQLLKEGESHTPTVHLGRFGSANTVMKSGVHRDRISVADKVTAFEMEGAGVWEQYPTIVIKAACDYGDSHKNKGWQHYAAAMAAACLEVFLKEWIIQEQPSGRDESVDPIWHIHFDPIPGFIGRKEELQKLVDKLFDANSRRVVSLLGLGGVGKSRLALEVAYRIKSEQFRHSIFWIQASKHSTFENDMLEIGRKLRIPGIDDEKADVKALVKQRLSISSTDKWLLILDNADDETLWGESSNLDSDQQRSSLVGYLPKTTNGSILITTRTRRVASFLAEKEVIQLSAMTQDEATKLFISKLEDTNSIRNRESLLILMNKLSHLPLAIVQAASYVNMTQISVQTYVDLLDQPEAEVAKLLSRDFGDSSRYPNAINPVATTWLISFEHIQKRHTLAANFLSAMACFHEKGIPLSLLPEVDSDIDKIEALAILIGYSFVTKQSRLGGVTDGEELYDVHRLVRLVARSWLRKEAVFLGWSEACIIHLTRLFPNGNHGQKSLWTMYLPHAQCVCEENGSEDLNVRYDLLEKMGWCFKADGKYDEAVRTLFIVVRWRERTLSKSDDKILEAYNNIGAALVSQGNFSEAEDYLMKAVSGRIPTLGTSHPSTLGSMTNLAIVLGRQGKYVEAEEMHREVLKSMETVLGKSHPSTLFSMNNLAGVLSSQGKYVEAEGMHREALKLKEIVLGKSHPGTLASMHNLACNLMDQNQSEEAVELMHSCTEMLMDTLGLVHPHTRLALYNLEKWRTITCPTSQQERRDEIQIPGSWID